VDRPGRLGEVAPRRDGGVEALLDDLASRRTDDRWDVAIWRVKVYAGADPLTGREIRFRKTCKTEQAAQIELLSQDLDAALAGTYRIRARGRVRASKAGS
jgi:hypothetical protein